MAQVYRAGYGAEALPAFPPFPPKISDWWPLPWFLQGRTGVATPAAQTPSTQPGGSGSSGSSGGSPPPPPPPVLDPNTVTAPSPAQNAAGWHIGDLAGFNSSVSRASNNPLSPYAIPATWVFTVRGFLFAADGTLTALVGDNPIKSNSYFDPHTAYHVSAGTKLGWTTPPISSPPKGGPWPAPAGAPASVYQIGQTLLMDFGGVNVSMTVKDLGWIVPGAYFYGTGPFGSRPGQVPGWWYYMVDASGHDFEAAESQIAGYLVDPNAGIQSLSAMPLRFGKASTGSQAAGIGAPLRILRL